MHSEPGRSDYEQKKHKSKAFVIIVVSYSPDSSTFSTSEYLAQSRYSPSETPWGSSGTGADNFGS